jgi:hypothetical protein
MASTALQVAGMLLRVPLTRFTPTSRDNAEWLEFSRGLVMEPVLPRPLVGSQSSDSAALFGLRSHTFSRQGWLELL